MDQEDWPLVKIIMWASAAVLVAVVGSMAGCPQYKVYSERKTGEAELARANANREILVAQARAEKEAAVLRAEAIGIVGKAAKEYPEYRQQEFIGAFADALKHGSIAQIIYVPTEGNIPLLQAGHNK